MLIVGASIKQLTQVFSQWSVGFIAPSQSGRSGSILPTRPVASKTVARW
jgi:hypothetical protein